MRAQSHDQRLSVTDHCLIPSGPVTSWQIDGEIMETVTDFIFSGSKITADGDCNHKIKRSLLLGRKAKNKLSTKELILLNYGVREES